MMSSTPRPRASRRSGSTSTETSRYEVPTRSTLPTPSTFSTRRCTSFSARSVSSRGGSVSERTASETIGSDEKSIFSTMGSAISSGSLSRMAATLTRASCTASATLTPSSNSIHTVETPSRDVEPTCLTPEMGLTASSTRLLTSRSTVSGAAPG